MPGANKGKQKQQHGNKDRNRNNRDRGGGSNSNSRSKSEIFDPDNHGSSSGTADEVTIKIKRRVGEGYVGQTLFRALEDSADGRVELCKVLERLCPAIYAKGYDMSKRKDNTSGHSLDDVFKTFQSIMGSNRSKSDLDILNTDKMQTVLEKLNDITTKLSPAKRSPLTTKSPKSNQDKEGRSSSSVSSKLSSSASSSSNTNDEKAVKSSSTKTACPPSPSSLARAWHNGTLAYADIVVTANTWDLNLNSILQSKSSLETTSKGYHTPNGSPTDSLRSTRSSRKSVGSTIKNTDSDAASVASSYQARYAESETDNLHTSDSENGELARSSDTPEKINPMSLHLYGKPGMDKAAIAITIQTEGFLRVDGKIKQGTLKDWFDENGPTLVNKGYDVPPFPQRGSSGAESKWKEIAESAARIILFEDVELRSKLEFDKTPKKSTKSTSKSTSKSGVKATSMSKISETLNFDNTKSPVNSVKGALRSTTKTKGTDPVTSSIKGRRRAAQNSSDSDQESYANVARRGARSKRTKITRSAVVSCSNSFGALSEEDGEDVPTTRTGGITPSQSRRD